MAERPEALKKPASGAAAPRVLLIDDDPRVTQTITRILAREYEVTALDRAGAALELLQSGARFDVVLCDLDTPGMSGAELLAELERLLPEVAARVVFLTAGVGAAAVRKFLGTASAPCIEKPFRLSELRLAVARRAGNGTEP